MATITISIGRNIGSTPMSDGDWDLFRASVRQVLLTYWLEATIFVDDALSLGAWNDIAEESSTFVAQVNDDAMNSLAAMLTGLARAYEQDAIALTVGETHLIGLED